MKQAFILGLLMLISLKGPAMELPEAAGVIDVTAAPYFADSSGKTDCSDALQQAFTDAAERTPGIFTTQKRAVQIVYLPAGTYRVSKPLVFTTNKIEKKRPPRVLTLYEYITGHMMLIGEGRDSTRIVLGDNAAAFQGEPVPVIRWLEREKTNQSFFNWMMDLTVDTGSGNPGAVAVEFVSSNIGGLRDVRLVCRDTESPSAAGLSLPKLSGGLSYLHRIEIDGFKRGIDIKGFFPGYLMEEITLKRQLEAGIVNQAKNLTIRKLQSENPVPALVCEQAAAITAILDSTLTGGSKKTRAIINEGHLFARNIETEGYGCALDSRGFPMSGDRIEEYVTDGTVKLFEDSPDPSLNLPIRETPDHPWPNPAEWTVLDTRAQDDDTAALQQLIDDGAENIFINGSEERLHLSGTIHLRNKLKRLHGGWTNMQVENSRVPGEPLFQFHTGEADFMVFEAFSNGQQRNSYITFVDSSDKPVVIRDVFMGYGRCCYRNTASGDLFLETVVSGGGDYPQIAENPTPGWLFKNQHVWWRNLNPEEWVPDVQIDEGAVVVGLGGKFGELYGTHLRVVNGARAELLGLMFNANFMFYKKWGLNQHTSRTGRSVEIVDANLALGAFHDGLHSFPDPVFIRETRGGEIRELKHADARLRGKEEEVVAPLFRSISKETDSIIQSEMSTEPIEK